jgi:hypothetical protein
MPGTTKLPWPVWPFLADMTGNDRLWPEGKRVASLESGVGSGGIQARNGSLRAGILLSKPYLQYRYCVITTQYLYRSYTVERGLIESSPEGD